MIWVVGAISLSDLHKSTIDSSNRFEQFAGFDVSDLKSCHLMFLVCRFIHALQDERVEYQSCVMDFQDGSDRSKRFACIIKFGRCTGVDVPVSCDEKAGNLQNLETEEIS